MKKNIFYFILFFLILNFSLFSKMKVETGKVVKKEISETYRFQGNFSVEKSINVFPKIRGVLIKLFVKNDSRVKKGDVIALVKRDDPGYKFKPNKITAPISGVVSRINAYEGTRVNSQSPILVISSYNPIILNVNIPEYVFYRVKIGTKVSVNINGLEKPYSGVVYTKDNAGDPKTKLPILKIKVKNPEYKIVPSVLGEAVIELGKRELVLAPADAVFSSDKGYFVWKIEDGRAFKKFVKVGELYGKYFEIKDGVSEGDLLVTFGAEKLRDGEEVVF